MDQLGRTLKIFVMGSDSKALKRVEIVNWTGVAFIGNRYQLQDARNRSELSEPGVYLLLSENPENAAGLVDIYVGETDDFNNRLTSHIRTKEWWDTFVVFVSKDQNLTKAHVKFLERELHLLAKASVSALRVRNDVEPGGSKLPESDISSMREFLNNMRFLLETLGLSYFPSSNQRPSSRASFTIDADFYITAQKSADETIQPELKSYMSIQESSYVLKTGSYIQRDARESFERHDSYHALWLQIINSDVVEEVSGTRLLRTIKDIEFRSPSAAAAIVKGGSMNGRTAWRRLSDDKRLAECEAEFITAA